MERERIQAARHRPGQVCCAGIRFQAPVTETPAGTSPVEYCTLGSRLRLAAEYGPFSDIEHVNGRGPYAGFEEAAGVAGLVGWGTAACSGAQGTALYTVRPTPGSDRSFVRRPLTERERANLREFAERSAARHGMGRRCCPDAAVLPTREGSGPLAGSPPVRPLWGGQPISMRKRAALPLSVSW